MLFHSFSASVLASNTIQLLQQFIAPYTTYNHGLNTTQGDGVYSLRTESFSRHHSRKMFTGFPTSKYSSTIESSSIDVGSLMFPPPSIEKSPTHHFEAASKGPHETGMSNLASRYKRIGQHPPRRGWLLSMNLLKTIEESSTNGTVRHPLHIDWTPSVFRTRYWWAVTHACFRLFVRSINVIVQTW